jgi:hypothetical protein
MGKQFPTILRDTTRTEDRYLPPESKPVTIGMGILSHVNRSTKVLFGGKYANRNHGQ